MEDVDGMEGVVDDEGVDEHAELEAREATESIEHEDAEPETPVIAVGQRWRDNDRRAKGRIICITEIDGEYAHADVEGTSRTTKIRIDRMKPGSTGWSYVGQADVPSSDGVALGRPAIIYDDVEGAAEVAGAAIGRQLVTVGPKFLTDRHGLSLNPQAGKPEFREYDAAVAHIAKINDGLQYWIGDLVNLGDHLFKEEASQAIDASRFSESTVKVCAWVCAKVPAENRRISPSFSHSQVVAALNPIKQRRFLKLAVENAWSVSKLKTEVLAETDDGKARLRFVLVIDCGTEAKQDKLADDLSTQGFAILRKGKSIIKKERKARKKKAEVTAQSSRPSKMNTKRRVPQGWDVKTGGKKRKK